MHPFTESVQAKRDREIGSGR